MEEKNKEKIIEHKIIFFKERERERESARAHACVCAVGEGQKERDQESQVGSMLSPKMGLDLMTLRA